jgi:predicted RNA-binding Zn ribbon-like protein
VTSELDDRSAPGSLELVRRFVNTLDIDLGIELLPSAAEAAAWLKAEGLLGGGRLSAAEHARLIALREALRGMLIAHATGVEQSAATAHVNEEVSRLGLRPAFTSSATATVQTTHGSGVEQALARILAIALDSAHAGTWTRLKACPAEDCHWAFYDGSKNRSSRWCYMRLCGAKAKRETFRRRHAPARP